MKVVLPASLFLLGLSLAAGDDSRVETLKEQKDAAVARAVAPIETRYRDELEKLLKTLTSANELEQALEVRAALEASGSGEIEPAGEVSSERLVLLRDQRADAIARARAPIEATYVEELEKLLRAATGAGNLDEAVRIKNELAQFRQNVTPLGEDPDGDEFTELALVGTEWELENAGEEIMLRFGEGKFQVHKRDAGGEWVPGDYRNWKMENPKRRQIRIFWHYGEEVATLNSKLTVMKDTKHVLRRLEQ